MENRNYLPFENNAHFRLEPDSEYPESGPPKITNFESSRFEKISTFEFLNKSPLKASNLEYLQKIQDTELHIRTTCIRTANFEMQNLKFRDC